VRSAILVAGCCLAIGILWLLLGSRFLLVFDRFFPGPSSAKPTDPLLIQDDAFGIGERSWPLPGRDVIKLVLDSQKRIVMYADGSAFTFGPVKTRWADPQYLFVPEEGDVVFLTRDVSRLSWQTPFAFTIAGGYLPKWHRYAYDRLRWTKISGASLEIVWRDQQDYFPGAQVGWYDSWNNKLASLRIRPSPVDKAAAAYLLKTKKWTAADYRLEPRTSTPDDNVVAAIYIKDESATHPGAGKSVILRVRKSSNKVVSETAFQ
jgi:hypothetical protein